MDDLPGGGVLIRAEKGMFVARAENGEVTVAPAGADIGSVDSVHDIPGGGVLLRTAKGWFIGVSTPIRFAKVDIRDRAILNGSQVDANHKVPIEFMIRMTVYPLLTPWT